MATSDAKIVNIALRSLRAAPITSLANNSSEGQLAGELYPDARDAVTAAHPWNFAMRRRVLAVLASPPAFTFAYAYTLPTDPWCLRAYKLNGSDSRKADGDFFKIEGRDLVTDASPANLLYVARVTDVTTYSPWFVQALAAYLRWQMAYAVTGSRGEEETAAAAYARTMRKARAVDSAEDWLDEQPVSPMVTGRL